jgi:hypothetical protein
MENNKPEKHIRFGGVRVSIWKDTRQNANGGSFESRSVTLDRAYKDANGEWKGTGTMRESDIPKAISALQEAYAYIMRKSEQDE